MDWQMLTGIGKVRERSEIAVTRLCFFWASLALVYGTAGAQQAADEGAAQVPAVAAEKDNEKGNGSGSGEGRLIRVRLPLTGNADAHLKSAIQRAIEQLTQHPSEKGRRPVLILELAPARRSGGYGEGTDFTRALSLADFLTQRDLAAVKTVAYVPSTIKGHGVLVALACEEIVMHPDAEIGDAGIDVDKGRGVDPKIVSAYQQIAAARRTVPEALALGMLDPTLEVLQVETDSSTEFVLASELDALKQNHTIVSQEVLVAPGALGSFTGREGRTFGFVKFLASDRPALARGLALPDSAVVEDQSLVGDWRPVMLALNGPITPRKVRQLETLIATELRNRKVNWIGLSIDSNGGEIIDCMRLAETIAALDSSEVQTVAYLPVEASGGAALVALACNQLIMQPEAKLGGKGTIDLDRPTLDAATISIQEALAKNSEHSWSLLAAMIDPSVELHSYQNTTTGETQIFSAEEAAEQPDKDAWRKGARINAAGQPLQLTAKQADEMAIATHVVNSFDEFKQLYGFESDPRTAEPNWALELVEALSSPGLAALLLVIGFVGIYIELHTPGLGAGAFVAALAFLLFFWSNFLHGTAGWLEVLLFVGGLLFLIIEMLLLPGFGIFGLGGGLMILSSLVLASQTFVLPQTESQLAELRHSLTVVAAATFVVLATSIALRRYLPQAPVFRTLMLSPTSEEELIDLDHRESLADYAHLIGQQGTAATNLMPSGKAEFDGQLVDVISEGLPIDRGQAVVVTNARGSRVTVRAV
jgi:membrane-bound serine protease (ClpP class)